jgi:hypothetical protein
VHGRAASCRGRVRKWLIPLQILPKKLPMTSTDGSGLCDRLVRVAGGLAGGL